jgi:PIN domain nuclease of toxin-antitoxin system
VAGGAFADACALISFFADAGAGMTVVGRQAMLGDVVVSSITVWELTRKARLGLLPPLPEENGSFSSWLAGRGFLPGPLAWGDTERANALPNLHKDPMDRMLIVQALRSGRPIITSDALFEAYGVTTMW